MVSLMIAFSGFLQETNDHSGGHVSPLPTWLQNNRDSCQLIQQPLALSRFFISRFQSPIVLKKTCNICRFFTFLRHFVSKSVFAWVLGLHSLVPLWKNHCLYVLEYLFWVYRHLSLSRKLTKKNKVLLTTKAQKIASVHNLAKSINQSPLFQLPPIVGTSPAIKSPGMATLKRSLARLKNRRLKTVVPTPAC